MKPCCVDKILYLFFSMMVCVLSGDLLYLYYAGGWVEPNQIILISELISLYVLVVGGMANSIRLFFELTGENGQGQGR